MKINGPKKPGKGKIRNATKVVYDDIKFGRKLDMSMYEALKKNELRFHGAPIRTNPSSTSSDA